MQAARPGLQGRLGIRPARHRLEFFPLHPRSLGQHGGVLLRHRLHSGRRELEGDELSGGGFAIRLGAEASGSFWNELREGLKGYAASEITASSYLPAPMSPLAKMPRSAIHLKDSSNTSLV